MAPVKPAGSWCSMAFLQCPCIAYFPVLPDREKREYRSDRAIFLEKYAWLFTDICTSLKCSPTTECLGKLRFLLCVGDAKSAWRTCARSLEMPGTGPLLILNSQFLQGHYFRDVEK